LQAAFLRVKLAHLNAWNERRARCAQVYLEVLHDIPLVLPIIPPNMDPVWHLFVVRTSQRDKLQAWLSAQGIGTLIHYPVPPHLQKAYSELGLSEGAFPITEAIHREVLSLPIGPHLSSQQQDEVIKGVRCFFEDTGRSGS